MDMFVLYILLRLGIEDGVQVSFWYFFSFFSVFFWFYVRGCCKNCKSHKDETNTEAAIGLFGYLLGLAVMGHADGAIERTLSRMTQLHPVSIYKGSEGFRWFKALRHSGF